ncbi:hypothetical protein GCM10022252_41910 [Streptosporangium oxazolinicum]|uniref:Uncharacterized protein n=1 Tax=Streptosporangium oxazolinicum TaxID=909287 RepID=A0ABP8B1C6_9ACTN
MAGDEVTRLRALRAEVVGAYGEAGWRQALTQAILRRCAEGDVLGTGNRVDLDEAAEHAGWLLAHDCDQWSFALVGRVHEVRWEEFGDPADRDVAITMLSEADDLRAENAWFSAADHEALAELLLSRHADRGVPYDLDLAVDRLRAALRECDDGWSSLYLRYRLGTTLALRVTRPGAGRADLGEAVALLEDVLPDLPEGDPATQQATFTLGGLLRTRGLANGSAADLERAAGHFGLFLEATPDDDPLWPKAAHDLASTLTHLGETSGDPAPLGRGMSLLARIHATSDRKAAVGAAWDLALALATRSETPGGSPADLDAAVEWTRRVLGEPGLAERRESPTVAGCHSYLAVLLIVRSRTGLTADLGDEGALLALRLRRRLPPRGQDDLDAALRHLEVAVALDPGDAGSAVLLGLVRLAGADGPAERAAGLLERAATRLASGDPVRSRLGGLAVLLRSEPVTEAGPGHDGLVEHLARAAAGLDTGHPFRPAVLAALESESAVRGPVRARHGEP